VGAELAHLRLQLDAATKENSMLGQQLLAETQNNSTFVKAEMKTREGLLQQLQDADNKCSLLHQQLEDEMQKNSKIFQQLDDTAKENRQVLQQVSAEMEKNNQVIRQLDAERKKSAEAEQLELSNAETIRNLREKMSRLQVQLSAAAHQTEAESAAAAKHALHQEEAKKLQQQLSDAKAAAESAQEDAKKLQEQLSAAIASADLDAKQLQQQLTEAHVNAESAQAEVTKLQQQLSDAFVRADLDAKNVQRQLRGAQVLAKSHVASTKQALQQQRIKLEASMDECQKHMAAAHHAELLAKVITRTPLCV